MEAHTPAISPIQQYQKILMAHDGSEMSDRALRHAIYLARVSGAELVVMNVIESDLIPPSSLLEFLKPDAPLEKAKEDLRQKLEGGVKQMLEERIRASKEAGSTNISYTIRIGKPVEEIINESQDKDYNLVVMASSKITSRIRSLGSVARRVLDSARKPILIIHE